MKLNFPNTLVLVRLLLVPIIIVLLLVHPDQALYTFNEGNILDNHVYGIYWTDLVAGILFLIASITDYVDGWYARKHDQITTFGKLFDPLADKILVNSTLIIFGARGIIPIVFVIIFVVRDILVDGLRMMLASNNVVLAADKWGKLKTIFQMIGLTLLFFIHPFVLSGSFSTFSWDALLNWILIIPVIIGLIFSIISGINYYVKGFKNLNLKEEKND